MLFIYMTEFYTIFNAMSRDCRATLSGRSSTRLIDSTWHPRSVKVAVVPAKRLRAAAEEEEEVWKEGVWRKEVRRKEEKELTKVVFGRRSKRSIHTSSRGKWRTMKEKNVKDRVVRVAAATAQE